MKKIYNIALVILIICVILSFLFIVLSLLKYTNIFNGDFSYKHSDWGEFGSFLSGIMAPITAFLATLIVLFITNQSDKNLKTQNDNQIQLQKNLKKVDFKRYLLSTLLQKLEIINKFELLEPKKLKAEFFSIKSNLRIFFYQLRSHFADTEIINKTTELYDLIEKYYDNVNDSKTIVNVEIDLSIADEIDKMKAEIVELIEDEILNEIG